MLMPSKHVVRSFVENGIYHVYNRGVEKRDIFLDDQDRKLFLYYAFIYLSPLQKVLQSYPTISSRLQRNNLSSQIELLSFCLMPNHFHLLIKQIAQDSISRLLRQLTNAYTSYFNQKYHRVGGLVQGKFKAVVIEDDELLLHVSRYIHLNPLVSGVTKDLDMYPWSSYSEYTQNKSGLCHKELILAYFLGPNAYKPFVLDHAGYAKEVESIRHVTLEE